MEGRIAATGRGTGWRVEYPLEAEVWWRVEYPLEVEVGWREE